VSHLSRRLETVASFVPEGSFLADVGSDHGQLPLDLLKQRKVVGAEAIENKPGPFSRLSKAVSASPFSKDVLLSMSDGLSQLDSRVNTVVLAGLGGNLIAQILNEGKDRLAAVDTIVIDAHEGREMAMKALSALSYRLEASCFLYEAGIPYEVQKWVKSTKKVHYSSKDYRFGPLERQKKTADWVRYWLGEQKRYEGILASAALPASKRKELENLVVEIGEEIQ
jgi:tRNA (adenine22-N1)-methyltransferase